MHKPALTEGTEEGTAGPGISGPTILQSDAAL